VERERAAPAHTVVVVDDRHAGAVGLRRDSQRALRSRPKARPCRGLEADRAIAGMSQFSASAAEERVPLGRRSVS
jgi:hypothetical protein